ncbi:MAG: protein-L-isoaspartate O-methyltransferase [Beijerinckiaceae bacterium]
MKQEDEALAGIRRTYAAATVRAAGCAGSAVEAAFATVPREDFLPPPPWRVFGAGGDISTSDPADLYCDGLVSIDAGKGINNGQPSLHATWIAACAPKAGETVVHVGCGGGYYSAILSRLVGTGGRIHAYEIEPDIALLAANSLSAYANVTVHAGSGTGGMLPHADVIYVNAAANAPQTIWLDCMKPGARLVFPWTYGLRGAAAMLVSNAQHPGPACFSARCIGQVSFIALEDEHDHRFADIPLHQVLAIRSLCRKGRAASEAGMVAEFDTLWFSTLPPE